MNYAELFAASLEKKWNDPNGELQKRFGSTRWEVTVEHGRKFDRIFIRTAYGDQDFSGRHVHAFVEVSTGRLVKAAGLKKPAMWGDDLASHWTLSDDVQFQDAVDAADFAGGYLYK